jgi:hypothetical protein
VPLSVGSIVSVDYVNNVGEEVVEGVPSGEPAKVCLGEAKTPTAPAGVLCIYQLAAAVETFMERATQVGPAGAILTFNSSAAAAFARGSWAVTAP